MQVHFLRGVQTIFLDKIARRLRRGRPVSDPPPTFPPMRRQHFLLDNVWMQRSYLTFAVMVTAALLPPPLLHA